MTQQYLEGVWSVYDTNGDGTLDVDEFAIFYVVLQKRSAANPKGGGSPSPRGRGVSQLAQNFEVEGQAQQSFGASLFWPAFWVKLLCRVLDSLFRSNLCDRRAGATASQPEALVGYQLCELRRASGCAVYACVGWRSGGARLVEDRHTGQRWEGAGSQLGCGAGDWRAQHQHGSAAEHILERLRV